MQSRHIIPVIITGAKRSGTSLIQYLFDSIPETFNFLDESFFLEYLYDIGQENIKAFIDIQQKAEIDELLKSTKGRYLFPCLDEKLGEAKGSVSRQVFQVDFDVERLKSTLRTEQKNIGSTVQAVWDYWLHALMDCMGHNDRNVRMAFFKSPDYGKSAVSALRYLGDSKIIMMVRDPRHAIDSLKITRQKRKVKIVHLFELLNIVKDYKFMKETVAAIMGSEKKDSLKVVKFEELVGDPAGKMKEIAGFLEIPFHDSMLHPTFNGKEWHGWSSINSFEGISDEPLKRQVTALTDWEIDFIKTELADVIKYFGYPCARR